MAVTPSYCGLWILLAAAPGGPPQHLLAYPELQTMIISALALSLIIALLALLAGSRSIATGPIARRHLRVVWNNEAAPRTVAPLRSGVGGITGRVPPRSAAGSPSSGRRSTD